MISRALSISIEKSLKNKRSILLIGPRQTGKSTLMRSLKPDVEYNLARQETFLTFARDPSFLESNLGSILPKGGVVFIDEVQRITSILNTIQYLIDKKAPYRFILTGSSARKLRRGNANLLPGRIHTYNLGPIVASELNYEIPTDQALAFGTLPGVVTEPDPREVRKLLKSYSVTYLNEEVKAEALTKNIEGFTRFLFSLAAESSHYLDLTKISKSVQVPRQTVQRFFEILEDTLIIKRLDAFAKIEKRRLIQHPRFFIFDNGVLNALLGNFNVSSDRKGQLFENFFFNQLETSLSYSDLDYRISNYRTDTGSEVDFVVEVSGEIIAIEVKSGGFSKKDLGGFNSLERYCGKKIRKIVVVPSGNSLIKDEVEIMPWQKALKAIGI